MPPKRKEHPPITHANLVPPYHDYAYFEDAAANPFRPAARGFEMVNAWWLAEAATLAFHLPGKVEAEFRAAGFSFVEAIERVGTECFVAANDEFVVVSFRGVESGMRGDGVDFRHIFTDLFTSARLRLVPFGAGAGAVHEGFLRAYEVVDGDLRRVLSGLDDGRRTFWFTGHSLGGALATIAAARAERLHGLYTYGSPRVGDVAFAVAFARDFAARFGVESYRFVNDSDIITVVPPHGVYRHVGSLKHIRPDGRISDDPTLLSGLSDTIADIGGKLRGLLLGPFAGGLSRLEARLLDLALEGVTDHVPTLYATHIWNAYAEEQGGGE
ncbi:MAG TPA: hypothetical protein VF611_20210 [Pyrinomonadaceae bacterium]